MNFYRIDISTNEKAVGTIPQISEAVYPTTIDDPRSLQGFLNRKADETVLIPKPILRNKAKLTDYLSSSLSMPLFSGKLKMLFETSLNFGIQFFETSIYINDKEVQDFWIANAYEYGYDYLDLNKSRFSIMAGILDNTPVEELKFNSPADVEKAFQQQMIIAEQMGILKHQPLRITTVAIREDAEIDFFPLRLVAGGVGFYISELLKHSIEKAGCSGIVFKAPNENWY